MHWELQFYYAKGEMMSASSCFGSAKDFQQKNNRVKRMRNGVKNPD